MIQRIQSIYLLLGAVAILVMAFFDGLWQSQAAAFVWFEPVLWGVGGLTVVAALATIFFYQNRQQQRKLVQGVQLLTVLLMAVLFVGLYLADDLDVIVQSASSNRGLLIAVLLPIVAYILFYLARKRIEHDIELVKSMDRLR